MKTTCLATILTAACASVLSAAELPSAKQLQAFPKNLARQHYATNLFLFEAGSQRFIPTEAAAAWLDDDSSTGWPALAGKQHYLLQFSEPQTVTSFSLTAKPANGTITIYSGEQAAAPGDKSWTPVAKDIAFDAINNKKVAKAIGKQTKYLLIETNIADPGPIYSLYVYGAKAAASEAIAPRAAAVDVRTVHGEFVNDQTAFSIASLYANARVTYLNTAGSNITWQRAIDENPETFASIKASGNDAGMIIGFDGAQSVSRLALLTDAGVKGKAEIYLLSQAPAAGQPVSVEGISPSVSLNFDGSLSRQSADFAETSAVAMAIRWTPAAGDTQFAVREINVFANLSLASHEIGQPATVGEGPADEAAVAKNEKGEEAPAYDDSGAGDGKTIADGKESKAVVGQGPGKEYKEAKPPGVALGPASGYRPGGLGFPPSVLRNPVSP